MLKNLPLSLLQATQDVIGQNDVLESCVSCGAVVGTCLHTDGQKLTEDGLSAQIVPGKDEPEDQLSGEKEEVVVNPEYKTFMSRRP